MKIKDTHPCGPFQPRHRFRGTGDTFAMPFTQYSHQLAWKIAPHLLCKMEKIEKKAMKRPIAN